VQKQKKGVNGTAGHYIVGRKMCCGGTEFVERTREMRLKRN
jgi:hypothetical protein